MRQANPEPGFSLRSGFALAALAGAMLSPAGRAEIPESLDDRAFWSLILEMSEPGGDFADENYVSNELGLQRLLPGLRAEFAPAEVYIGVGPEQNFSYIAALSPGIAFVVDIRRQNAMEHLMYKALFELAETRTEFVARLFSRSAPPGLDRDMTSDELLRAFRSLPSERPRLDDTRASIFRLLIQEHGFALSDLDRASIVKVLDAFSDAGPAIAYVDEDADDWHPNYVQLMNLSDASGANYSYLGSEERYGLVRDMQLKNLIVPVVGDFAGPRALRAIGDFAREHGARVDVFYVSNVEPYLFGSGNWRPFYENLLALPIDADSLFVRTFFGSTLRACPEPRPLIRTPLKGPIADFLTDYRNGEIRSQCDLVTRSR